MNVEAHTLYTRAYKLQHAKSNAPSTDLSNLHAAIRLYEEIMRRTLFKPFERKEKKTENSPLCRFSRL